LASLDVCEGKTTEMMQMLTIHKSITLQSRHVLPPTNAQGSGTQCADSKNSVLKELKL
jgi:hypothetical protein